MPFLRDRSNRLRLGGYAVLIAAVAVVLTFGLLSIYHSASASSSVARTVTVEVGTVASSVSASGNMSPSESDSVNFETGGTLTAVDVAVGDKVKAGEVLAKIDPTDADDALKEAEDSVQVAESALADAEAGGTTSQLEQNQASMTSSELQLTSDQEQLSTDQTSLSEAESALTSDQGLGCPAGSSQSSTGNSSTGNSSNGSSSNSGSNAGSSAGGTSTTDGEESPTTTTTVVDARPTVVSGSASALATTTATLGATVDPGGLSTSYKFEYGTTDSYGHQTTSQSVSGSGAQSVSASITGLDPDTSYIFRVVATNSLGSATGLGVAFTTAQSSCVTEQQVVTTDQQTVARDEGTVSAEEQSIAASEAGQAPVSSTILQDESQILTAQQTVTEDQKAVDETTLVAPIGGTVTAVSDQVGDTVDGGGSTSDNSSASSSSSASTGGSAASSNSSNSSSSAFITIDNLASLQVVAGFAEADATSIAAGQGATVTLAALPSTEVAGSVVSISPIPTVVSNVVTYDVTIGLDHAPATVKRRDDRGCEHHRGHSTQRARAT